MSEIRNIPHIVRIEVLSASALNIDGVEQVRTFESLESGYESFINGVHLELDSQVRFFSFNETLVDGAYYNNATDFMNAINTII